MKKPVIKIKKKGGHGLGSAVSLSAVGLLVMLFLPWMTYSDGAGRTWIGIGCFCQRFSNFGVRVRQFS